MPRRSSSIQRIAATSLVAAMGLLVGAHTGADATSSARITERKTSEASPVAAAQTAKSWKLLEPLDGMGDTKFGPWVEGPDGPTFVNPIPIPRKCKGAERCRNKATRTFVLVEAAAEVKDLDLNKDLEKDGVVIARLRIEKTGGSKNLPERRYGFVNDDFTYYLVVENDKYKVDDQYNRIAKWSLVEVDPENTHLVVMRGTFRRCYGTDTQMASHAGFSECPPRGNPRPMHAAFQREADAYRALIARGSNFRRQADSVRMEMLRTVINPEEGPIWASCVHGCCIADN
jgi:hypothetical protein